ncbi:hypothetical protein SH139x_003969 [Planctomycetaceae bacterium SH139]
MHPRSLVVISVDGLATAGLGPYGCSWLDTPGFNQLAAEGVVFDRLIASSTEREEVLREFWQTSSTPHSSQAGAPQHDAEPTCQRLADWATTRGYKPLLFTDCRQVAQLASSCGFEESHLVMPAEATLAASIEETLQGRLFATALAHWEERTGNGSSPENAEPQLLWIHVSALLHTWDAPLELRASDDLLDEDAAACSRCEEEPEELVWNPEQDDAEDERLAADRVAIEEARLSAVPPRCQLSEADDPDLLLAWMTAYGAQVQLLDSLLELLRQTLVMPCDDDFGDSAGEDFAGVDSLEVSHAADQSTALVVVSTSGFALGEHGFLGAAQGPPRSNRVQLPMLIEAAGLGPIRCAQPASSARVRATLADLLGLLASVQQPRASDDLADASLLQLAEPTAWAEPLATESPVIETRCGESAEGLLLRTTPGWFLATDETGEPHLYLKPDDRNDANDIASLKPEIVATLL